MRPPSSPILDPFSYSHPYIHQEVREYALSPWYIVYLTGWSVLSNLTDLSVNSTFIQENTLTESVSELSTELDIPSQVLILNNSIIKAAARNISSKPELSRNQENSDLRIPSQETSNTEEIRQDDKKIRQDDNKIRQDDNKIRQDDKKIRQDEKEIREDNPRIPDLEFLNLELAQEISRKELKTELKLSNNASKNGLTNRNDKGHSTVKGQDTNKNIQKEMNASDSHLALKILESLAHSLHIHRKLNVRVNSVKTSLEGTCLNISMKRPLSLQLHKKMLRITSIMLGGKPVSVVVKSGSVEHVYVNLEKVPPNRLVMFVSFGLGFLGIGGSVLVMVYLGTRMAAINSAEDSKHLMENQCDDDEDESDVFLGPNPPKPQLQISVISNKDEKSVKGQKKPSPANLVDDQEPVFQVFDQEDKKFNLQTKFETIGI